MTMRTRKLGWTLAWALVVAMLMATIGLLAFDGLPSVSAQADTTAPTISSVAITSDPDDGESRRFSTGVYGIGDSIEVTVTFSEDVTVSGAPQLEVDIGGSAKTATYGSVDGDEVVFSYTVAEGDSDKDGIAVGADKLTLNGGSIQDTSGNAASLTHSALQAQTSHKVDGIRLRLTRFAFIPSTDGANGYYTAGEVLRIDTEWSETLRLSDNLEATISVDIGGIAKTCTLVSSYHIYFGCPIQAGDYDADGPTVAAGTIQVGDGWIRDTAGNSAVLTHRSLAARSAFKVDAILPYVTGIEITSEPDSSDGYVAGEAIEITVTFNETVTVPIIARTGATGNPKPKIEIDVGGQARTADFLSTSGSSVVFSYTVASGDSDSDGVSIGANKLSLNGGAIVDQARNTPLTSENEWILGLGLDARVTHSALGDDSAHRVSADSSVVSPRNFPATGTPVIWLQPPVVGQTLRVSRLTIADRNGLTSVSYSYQWISNDGTTDTEIEGETSSTYTVQASDHRKFIKVQLTFTDDQGFSEWLTSEATSAVLVGGL